MTNTEVHYWMYPNRRGLEKHIRQWSRCLRKLLETDCNNPFSIHLFTSQFLTVDWGHVLLVVGSRCTLSTFLGWVSSLVEVKVLAQRQRWPSWSGEPPWLGVSKYGACTRRYIKRSTGWITRSLRDPRLTR